jgi:hypothetical protein
MYKVYFPGTDYLRIQLWFLWYLFTKLKFHIFRKRILLAGLRSCTHPGTNHFLQRKGWWILIGQSGCSAWTYKDEAGLIQTTQNRFVIGKRGSVQWRRKKVQCVGKNNRCPPQNVRILHKSNCWCVVFLKGKYCLAQEGEKLLCTINLVFSRWQWREELNLQVHGICLPGGLISKKGGGSFQCKWFIIPEFPNLSFRWWLKVRC